MNKEQLDFVIEWASMCKKQNRTDLHCNVYWEDNSPLEITLYDHKALRIYDELNRKEWMNLFKEALNKNIIKLIMYLQIITLSILAILITSLCCKM